MLLKNKVAIITGSTKGIGKATAKLFVKEGAKVVINGRNLNTVNEVVAEIKNTGAEAIGCAGDVALKETAINITKTALDNFGSIDILINNAAITAGKRFSDITDEEWDKVLNTNLKGTFMLVKEATKNMIARKYGKIINLSSIYYRGGRGQLHYDSSKGALVSFTRSLSLELAKYNINVNCVAPGLIDTDMPKIIPKDLIEKQIALIPFRRAGQPEEVAELLLFLSSEKSTYITGQIIHINGGAYMGD